MLFEATSNEALLSLVKHCAFKNFSKGECCITSEKNLYNFYVIRRGKIKVFNLNRESDKQFTLFILSQDDVFDVFTLINNQQHDVYYEILEDVELVVIAIHYLRAWLKDNPAALTSFFKYTIKEFELLESHILDLGTNGITARFANLLLHYYNFHTNKIEGINDLTHDELAQLVGTSRAVLNRHIQEFKKEGIITVGRKHIEVIHLSLLIEKSHHGCT